MENKKDKKDKNILETTLNFFAGMFACIGIAAIIYKLSIVGLTKESITDATVNLAQILTLTTVVFASIFSVIKNNKSVAKMLFNIKLKKWSEKYGQLAKFGEIYTEDNKNYSNYDKKCIKCQMLMKHSDFLKEENELGVKAYTDFVKMPVEKLAKSQIMFHLIKKMFDKACEDKKSFEKTLETLISKIQNDYKDIIEKAWYTGIENGQMTRQGKEDMYIHIQLKKDLKDNAKTYDRITELLDFMTMTYLAIA